MEGGAEAVMTSYNEINGIPAIVNDEVRHVLKGTYGLPGHVVCDGGDFSQTVNDHHFYQTHGETLANGLKAGVDCFTDDGEIVYAAAREALDNGWITEKDIDESVRNSFRTRIRLGMFDKEGDCPYQNMGEEYINNEEHKQLARKMADEAVVLLKNEKSSYKVKPLDVITVMMDRPRYENEIIPENIPLNIVYEDPYVMVVNKPAGLVVHPGHGNYHGTLVNALAWHLKDIPEYDANDPHVGLVHRIDKDTSGLLVIAKTPDAKTNLGIQFFNKTTKRRYRALVWGNVEQDEGTIVGSIARNPKDRMQMAVMSDPTMGKHAVTHYRVLERLGYVTLVECILETGRTHQIRVHMKHIGHVLFNDERYGGHEILKGTHFSKYKQFVNNCFDTCPRQALHAMTLGFVHPVTGEEMYFTSELPDDMTQLIEKWRGYISNREIE